MVEAGNVTIDMASVEYADAIRLCHEGLLEPIDINSLPAGDDGTPAAEDFLAGAVTDCGVSTDIWANIYAYDTTKFAADAAPKTVADLCDPENSPGKRGLKKGAKAVVEFALMGDGVPRLETPAHQAQLCNAALGVGSRAERHIQRQQYSAATVSRRQYRRARFSS